MANIFGIEPVNHVLDVKDENGNAVGLKITICHPDSPQAKAAERAFNSRLAGQKNKNQMEAIMEGLPIKLAGMIDGWEWSDEPQWNGVKITPVPFSKKNAEALLSTAFFVRIKDQIAEVTGDSRNFLECNN
jgi:hypothetical protein